MRRRTSKPKAVVKPKNQKKREIEVAAEKHQIGSRPFSFGFDLKKELPGLEDFKSELENFRMGQNFQSGRLFLWKDHFSRLLAYSLQATLTCLHPNVSQEGLLAEAEKNYEGQIKNDFEEIHTLETIRFLRNKILEILIFLRRASQIPLTNDPEANKVIQSELLASLDFIQKWHTRPKGKIDRRRQRRKKRKSPPRKYGSEFMDQCADYVRQALEELGEFIIREGVTCNSGNYNCKFVPKIFPRTMPSGIFGVDDESFDSWSKWLIDMLIYKSIQGKLCRETLRKRKKDILGRLIPDLWDAALNDWKR